MGGFDTKKDTTAQGAGACHLVCADLLLGGYRAFIAAEGYHYDVVLDLGGRLLRVQVKSSGFEKVRPRSPNAPASYHFETNRGHRPNRIGQKSKLKRYDNDQIDLLALVAIDIRAIAYIPVIGPVRQGIYLYPPGTSKFLRRGVSQRPGIDEFPIAAAISNL